MVKVRIFRKADAIQVSRLIRKTLMSTNKKDYPLSILKPLHDYFTPAKVKVLASERFCLVVEEGEKIVATGALEGDRIRTVFVDPKFQRRGIGKKLLGVLEKRALKDGKKYISVAASMTGTDFYRKLSYKKTKVVMDKHAGLQTWMKKRLTSG